MSFHVKDLFTWSGELARRPYAIVGIVLMVVKYNLDRLVAAAAFDTTWSVFNYLQPVEQGGLLGVTQSKNLPLFGTLLAMALPFIYVGVVTTLKRLKDAGLPQWMVAGFFVPVVNFLLFVTLCILPSKQPVSGEGEAAKRAWLERIVPRSALGSAAAGLALTLPPAVITTVFGVHFLESYGWGLFVGVPFAMGLGSVVVYGYRADRSFLSCLGVSVLSALLLGGLFVALAIEGVICIIMATPLAATLAALGGVAGYFIQRSSRGPNGHTEVLLLALIAAQPLFMGFEQHEGHEPPVIPLRTSVTIDAPPEIVWHHVVAFSELPKPESWMFKAGVAYPVRAKIEGRGVGAVRHCIFSTGPFVEPITVWDAPRLLKFDVTSQPPAMREMSPWGAIDAPHIDDYLVSKGGQFKLTALPDGKTHLEGTTWYQHRVWPVRYWQVFSDQIIHSIHYRVLNHVKNLSETDRREGVVRPL